MSDKTISRSDNEFVNFANITNNTTSKKSIKSIVVSSVMTGVIFATILVWYQFIEVFYKNLFPVRGITRDMGAVYNNLLSTIFVTVLTLIILFVTYKLGKN